MPEQGRPQKIAVIVPAYNEAERISDVLKVLVDVPLVDEIIVVDDGSIDNTSDVARGFDVKAIRLTKNLGKGGAMIKGAEATNAEIIAFIDADLVGLKPAHIEDLIEPVLNGKADMTIGMFTSGRLRTDLSQKMFPAISGQRALKRTSFMQMEGLENTRYGIELAITDQAKRLKLRTVEVLMEQITQVMKEEKLGYAKGLAARLKMYKDMFSYFIEGHRTKP